MTGLVAFPLLTAVLVALYLRLDRVQPEPDHGDRLARVLARLRDDAGASAPEYAIGVAFVVVATLLVIQTVQTRAAEELPREANHIGCYDTGC